MKSIIIVSKCLRVIKLNSDTFYEFHFKGVCQGRLIKKIRLKGLQNQEIVPGGEYIIQLRDQRYMDHLLEGEIVKFRLLEECLDRS